MMSHYLLTMTGCSEGIKSIGGSSVLLMLLLLTGSGCGKPSGEGHNKTMKTAYILPGKVYEAYPPARENRKRLEKLKEDQEASLDTLRKSVQGMRQKLIAGEGNGEALRKRYQQQQRMLQQRVQRINRGLEQRRQALSDSVWQELNNHIRAYGREKGYDYIYGASGQGNLMYADSTYNVTPQVIEYVQARYDSVQKSKKDSLKQ